MKLYNSLIREPKEFTPLKKGEISIYSCGPTVYDRAHIGNLASFIYADTLRRALTLEFPEAKIKHVMNITDVDDKTIKRSQEEYPNLEPMAALEKLTRHYEKLFMQDLEAVGVDVEAITFVRATNKDSINGMQLMIREIFRNGFAYLTNDGIFFDTLKYHNYNDHMHPYGKLTDTALQGLIVESQRTGSDEYEKHEAVDFALWKKQKPGEPAWDFQIDGQDLRGRPGWHIECSAMSVGELGQPFDIHTGGVDLKFPHHENEIAQAVAAHDNPNHELARFFVHSEHILVDGQKMSKSLNNFYTLEDIRIRAKNFDPLAFRLLVLQSHYRSQAHFSWENLEAAQNRLRDFRAMAALRWQPIQNEKDASTYILKDIPTRTSEIASEDLSLPAALALINDVESQVSAVLIDSDESNPFNSLSQFEKMLEGLDLLLGLKLENQADITDDQKQIIDDREKARAEKDFAKSDELRAKLEEQGIGLRDTPHGPIWFRL